MDNFLSILLHLTGTNFLAILLMGFFYFYIKKRTPLPPLYTIGKIIPVLLVRELLFFGIGILNEFVIAEDKLPVYPLDRIVYIGTELIIIFILLRWYSQYTGKKSIYTPFIIINLILVVMVGGDSVFHVIYNITFLGKIYPTLFFIVNYIILSAFLYSVSEYNTPNPSHIMGTRTTFVQATMFLNVAAILLLGAFGQSYNTPFMRLIYLPAYYLLYIYLIYSYIHFYERAEKQRIQYLQNDLNSVFDFMQNLGSAIAEKLELHQILNFITASAVKSTNAQAGSILLIDEFDSMLKVEAVDGVFPPPYQVPDRVKVKISRLQDYFKSQPIKLGENIFGEVAQSGKPIFIKNTTKDPRMKQNTQNDTLFVSSFIAIPLLVSKRIIGVISVIKRERDRVFTENDYDHLRTFADFASLTIDFILTYMELIEKREMERELGIAAEIQQKLLPRKLPAMKAGTLAAFSIPAKGVSGDYYDVLQFKNNRFGMVICDVAGKGVPAALIMVMIRSILHLITSAEKNAANVVTWINRGITGKIDIDRFATLSFLTYDENTGEVIYSNAAHHPLLIFRHKTATIEAIDTEGLPIGVERTAKYGQKRFKLSKGDLIVLYTDGIIEAMNPAGQQYTYERFTNLVSNNANLPPDDLIVKIKADLGAFVGNAPQHDDQTLMLMKVN
ncbi:MAG: SpoIIE family protein phosphatase [Spirochaetales bacterium]|nr:SpoIIE family protein phosphatase [Spirochaetales bacterium]